MEHVLKHILGKRHDSQIHQATSRTVIQIRQIHINYSKIKHVDHIHYLIV